MNSSFDATEEEADEWADAPPVIGWRAPATTEAPTRVTSSTWTDGYDQPTPIQTHTPTPTPIQKTTKLETDEFYSDPTICARDLAKEARLFSAKHESGINFDAYASVSVKLDMGFGYQVRRILGEEDMHERRQTLLFSATFPANLQNITMLYMSNYLFLTIGRINAANTNITQQIICVDSLNDKKSHLLDLLATKYPLENQPPSTHLLLTLIFVRSKNVADEIANYLLDNNYDANSIHGGRDQQERTAALDAFKKGISPILVATDIASRGLDVPNVGLVVNFDLPRDSVDDYVHRIGRTGRAGNVGLAVSFYVPGRESEALRVGLCKCLKESGQEVPPFMR
ncbi:DEAD-box ATP-dependent RNA helicase [Rhizoclosmatium hyalinum]|nr:DEAD-box ATP-dependent RNA helicase [Rhizoclosmatium hyalinum]